MSRRAGRVALGGWAVAVGVVIVVLQRNGGGALRGPALGRPATWADWVHGRDPVTAAVALLRLGALAAAWYLLAAAFVGAVGRWARADRLVSQADRLTPAVVRRILAAAAGLSIVTPVLAGVGAPLGPVAAAVADAAPASTSTSTSTATSTPPPTLTMHLLGPGDAATVPSSTTTIPPSPALASSPPMPPASAVPAAAAGPPDAPAAGGGDEATWTGRPGECFWSIADDVLARAWGRRPSDAEIVPYWHTLIELNRNRLADRANANLIFPSQVFVVPAPPPVPAA